VTFRLLSPTDDGWLDLFTRLPIERQDVFHSPGFAVLCQETIHADNQVMLAAWDGGGHDVILYPFAKRDLAKLCKLDTLSGLYDITGLYGRGGLAVGSVGPEGLAAFHRHFAHWCAESGVICTFDRYHPVWANESAAAAETKVMDVGGFVVVDMTDDIETIESRYKYSVRKDLRKAERGAVSTDIQTGDEVDLDRFLEVYYGTMDRNNAGAFYYFERPFFEGVSKYMSGQYLYIHSRIDGQIVSTELVLRHGLYAHSFLGGTDRWAQPHCPNHRLKRDLIRHLKQIGCRWFLLGGGSSENDGIFNYKRAFAPDGVLPSRIGATIVDAAAYAGAKDAFAASGRDINSRRFQFYDPN